ncbi:MAG: RagB/SusD family nutrient uptake outer membrane protein [Bacteroidales bacterium]
MKIKYIILSVVMGSLFSCVQYEDVPLEDRTIDVIFSETDSIGKQAEKWLTGLYSILEKRHNGVSGDYLGAATDDAISSSNNETDVQKLALGQYTSMSIVESEMNFVYWYKGIRRSNIFIENILRVPLMDEFEGIPMNVIWQNEARFLRAYSYFELIKRYGGVPLLRGHVIELGEDMAYPRDSFETCVDFIIAELDEIENELRTPNVLSAKPYAVTAGAVAALRVRVLLYAASPLFNNQENTNPLLGYTNYDAGRWKLAVDAVDYFTNTYGYYGLYEASGDSTDFTQTFIVSYEQGNPEDIFHMQIGDGTNKEVEVNNGPVGFSAPNVASGRTSPSQNLAEAFPMRDGKAIGESSYSYDFNNQYVNRDPRFYGTLLYQDAMWLTENLQLYMGGKSNPNGSGQKTKTGYYMRKFMGDYANEDRYSEDYTHNWMIFRYAEILLNYAEALNEFSGPSNEVYNALISIRRRAGIEEGDGYYGLKANMTKDEMREAIHNERRIEMAFEEQRYWDLRRWKKAETVLNQSIEGLIIVKNGPSVSYTKTTVLQPSFEEKSYYYPFPYTETLKNPNLFQNPGWE